MSLFYPRILLLILLIILPSGQVNTVNAATINWYDQRSAVVFVYYRIDEPAFRRQNIIQEQFDAQMEELTLGNYNILSLPEIVKALEKKAPLPRNTIALSFDGGYQSFYTKALPILQKYKLPYTVFVSTNQLDGQSETYMKWNQIKEISKDPLSTIGLHSASYQHLDGKNEAVIRNNINRARGRIREIMAISPKLFSYPFGEYSPQYKSIIQDNHFMAAVGQDSGPTHAGSDMFALPRFTMTEAYADIDRFKILARSLPLPAQYILPIDHKINIETSRLGFTVGKSITTKALKNMSCFISGQRKPNVDIVENNRVIIIPQDSFSRSRTRLNCTLPETNQYGEKLWRWFGVLFKKKDYEAEEIIQEQDELP